MVFNERNKGLRCGAGAWGPAVVSASRSAPRALGAPRTRLCFISSRSVWFFGGLFPFFLLRSKKETTKFVHFHLGLLIVKTVFWIFT